MSGSGQVALLDVQEWSRGTPASLGVVGRLSRMSGSGREVLRDVREWSGGSPECPRVVGRPSRMSVSIRRSTQMSGSG